MNLVPAVAKHFYLALTATFNKPGGHFLALPSKELNDLYEALELLERQILLNRPTNIYITCK